MWMLERASESTLDAQDFHQLAACPDTHGRGDKWRWAVNFVRQNADEFMPIGAPDNRINCVIEVDGHDALVISHDPALISTLVEVNEQNSNLQIERKSGTQVLVVPLFGEALVAAPNGVWKRLLHPGDVFVIEGEEEETLFLTPSPDLTRIVVIHLESNTAQALRWVP
jgi:hypothetical protein